MKKGFTLAEVLITLGIIGIVAAMTIPTLISKYQKKQVVSQLKKEYTTLAQAVQLSTIDNGEITSWRLGENQTGEAAAEFMNTYLVPYMKVAKAPEVYGEGNWDGTRYYLGKTTANSYTAKHARMYLSDGASITTAVTNTDSEKNLYLYIDINGDKDPNRFGKDIFYYIIGVKSDDKNSVGRVLPAGYNKTREEITENTSSNKNGCAPSSSFGYYCAQLIMMDGWEIKDDYPW